MERPILALRFYGNQNPRIVAMKLIRAERFHADIAQRFLGYNYFGCIVLYRTCEAIT